MRVGLIEAQTLKTLWVIQYLAPLLGQGDDLTCEFLLPGPADVKHLLGFLPSGKTAQSRQAQRHAIGIRRLTRPMALGHPKKRFDGIGADRQADMIEPEGRGGLQFEIKIGSKLLTQGGRGHSVNERLATGRGCRAESLILRSSGTQVGRGHGLKALDEGFTGGQLIQAGAQLG